MSEKDMDLKEKIAEARKRLSSLERNAKVTLLALGATAFFGANKINAATPAAEKAPSPKVSAVTTNEKNTASGSAVQYAGEVVFSKKYGNGNVMYEKYESGATRSYYENGNLKSESQFGITKRYYENKKLESISLPSGITQTYYENGNLMEEELPYGVKYYNKDGSLKKTELVDGATVIVLSDGTRAIYYEDYLAHKKKCVENTDGSWQVYDMFFKKLELERTADGTHRIYSGGKVAFEYTANGTATNYDSNGNVESQYVFSRTTANSITPTQTSAHSQSR